MHKIVSADPENNQGKILATRQIKRAFLADLIAAKIDQENSTSLDSANVAIEVLEGLGFLACKLTPEGDPEPPDAA